jgi:uncharacterized protein (TIGR02301 family)
MAAVQVAVLGAVPRTVCAADRLATGAPAGYDLMMACRILVSVAITIAVLSAGDRAAAQAPASADPRARADLSRLAEVLGGAHYLRITCQGRSDQRWRALMVSLLDREGTPGDPKREDLIAAFNKGYRSYELRFSGCSEAALAQEADLRQRGEALARNLAGAWRR